MKIKIWIIAIVIAILLFAGLTIAKNVRTTKKDYQSVIEQNKNTIEHYEGKAGNLIAEKKVLLVTNKELKQIADDVIDDNDVLKSQIKGLKNLNTYLNGQLAIVGEGSTTIYDTAYITKNDTIYVKTFNYKTDYLDFSGTINKSTLDFQYTYRTDFQYVEYWKRPGVFKQKELVMNFSLTDPNAKLTSAQSITIKPEPKKFYQTQWFSGLIGLGAGILIVK